MRIEEIERIWQEQKHSFNTHHRNVVEGRIKRAKWEGVQEVLEMDAFYQLEEEERQDWAVIPLKTFYYWARGPIVSPETGLDGIRSQEHDFWETIRGNSES